MKPLRDKYGDGTETFLFPKMREGQFLRQSDLPGRGRGADVDLNVDWWVTGEEGRLGQVGGWLHRPALASGWLGAQRLLNSSFFLLQSICGARLLLRFWWALSLATAREMLKSKMGS